MTEQDVIEAARQVVREETGTENPDLVLIVLARMVIVADRAASGGYMRRGDNAKQERR